MMDAFPKYLLGLIGFLCLILTISVSADTYCSPGCLEAPASETTQASNETATTSNETSACNETNEACNETRLTCNETTLECLYGCQAGYGGERCQFLCANNCSNCTIGECEDNCNITCDNSTCTQTPDCVDGCLEGFHGLNCSLPCPENCLNSTCDRENGACLLGCKEDFFGDTCELSCSPFCKKASVDDTDLTCNETTLACLYGCKTNFEGDRCDKCQREWTGPSCNIKCDYYCQKCAYDPNTMAVTCELCFPGYHPFNKKCTECSRQCKKKPGQDLTCDQMTGRCNFGCDGAWWDDQCSTGCSTLCVNGVCSRDNGNCSEGCKKDTYGGIHCDDTCDKNCVDGRCYRNMTCKQGCNLNHWGPSCSQTCSQTCRDAPNTYTSTCDSDGVCTFGCKKTYMGPACSKQCSSKCIDTDCDATSGHCLQGCTRGYWTEDCSTNCSTNCRESHCKQVNGYCEQGCIVGFFGPLCDADCHLNCVNDTCFRWNGTCALGCKEGFIGDNCTATEPSEPTTIDVKYIAITAGGSGAGFIALIVVALVLKNRYIAYKEAEEVKKEDRRTRVLQNEMKKKRDNRKSQMPMIVVNEGFGKIPLVSDSDEEGVLAVDELLDHVMKTDNEGFAEEFKKLPANVERPGKQKPKMAYKGSKKVKFTVSTPVATQETVSDSNAALVQIENIVLDNLVNESTERTYNASMIEVYSRTYIAAEGPSVSTSVDFWLLVWSKACPVLVMLTPTSINKQSSSKRYWPDSGKSEIYGNVTITNVREDTFANFTSREFKVEKDKETRVIQQLQLILWPDDKTFPNIADMMDFYMYFRAVTKSDLEPVLVHCSEGEGRTGVFIAMDLMVRDGERYGKICVLDCVRSLREQRDNMVQTKEQYKFLYSLVAQTLQMRCKSLQENEFVEAYKKSQEPLESNQLFTHIEDSYENMRAAIVMKSVDQESVKKQWNLKMKNREGADIPEDQYRPILPGGAYINALYMDSLSKKDMITTQMPLLKTVVDFYRLIAAEKCHVIVMLNPAKTKEKDVGIYWPTKGKTVKHQGIYVTLDDTDKTDDYKQLSLTLSDYSRKSCCKGNVPEDEDLHVSLFQLKHWESGPRPSNTVSMLRLIQAVKAERKKYEPGPLIVHCLNGSERSGIFCALYELTDAIERGLSFSVINTVYKIKYRRPSAILNLDQYKFIHEALEIFITSEEFRGEPVQAEVPMIEADDED